MNIKNTMCRLSELSQWEINSLVDAMPPSVYLERGWYKERTLGFDKKGNSGFWNELLDSTIVTYTEMMQLLGKTMQFTKSDLIKLSQSETVFVKQRNGNFKVVLGKAICGNDYSFGLIDNYNRDMTITCNETHLDIVAVYITNRSVSLNLYLKGTCLTLIWERTEQTEAQKEMEVLQAQAKALQEDTQAIQEQITKLQGTL
jgi:hypothetical protein